MSKINTDTFLPQKHYYSKDFEFKKPGLPVRTSSRSQKQRQLNKATDGNIASMLPYFLLLSEPLTRELCVKVSSVRLLKKRNVMRLFLIIAARCIFNQKPIRFSEVHKTIGADHTYYYRLLSVLIQLGLVEKHATHSKNKQGIAYWLSSKGWLHYQGFVIEFKQGLKNLSNDTTF